MSPERRSVAILFTDIVGYSALMAANEAAGLRVRARHREVLRPLVRRYHGDWIESPSDQSLSVFPSAHDAVNCALAIQAAVGEEPDLALPDVACRLCLESLAGHGALADDRAQRPEPQFRVIGDGHGARAPVAAELHHHMAAAAAHLAEAVGSEDAAYLAAG